MTNSCGIECICNHFYRCNIGVLQVRFNSFKSGQFSDPKTESQNKHWRPTCCILCMKNKLTLYKISMIRWVHALSSGEEFFHLWLGQYAFEAINVYHGSLRTGEQKMLSFVMYVRHWHLSQKWHTWGVLFCTPIYWAEPKLQNAIQQYMWEAAHIYAIFCNMLYDII